MKGEIGDTLYWICYPKEERKGRLVNVSETYAVLWCEGPGYGRIEFIEWCYLKTEQELCDEMTRGGHG